MNNCVLYSCIIVWYVHEFHLNKLVCLYMLQCVLNDACIISQHEPTSGFVGVQVAKTIGSSTSP